MSEKTLLLPKTDYHATVQYPQRRRRQLPPNLITIFLLLLIILLFRLFFLPNQASVQHHDPFPSRLPLDAIPERLQSFQDCSIHQFISDTELAFLSTAHPLATSEFSHRRDRLAQALVDEGVDAFAMEPGYTFQYYANASQSDWGSSERPFVMIIQPSRVDGTTKAKTSFLLPSFEAGRARLLRMAFDEPIDLITYEEHWNYYSTLRESAIFETFPNRDPVIMVDAEMRDFVSRGLAQHGFDIVGLGGDVERVRQTKSEAEIGIMRAVNTGTAEALRAMRHCLTPDLTEDDVRQVLDNTLRAGSLDPSFSLVLFDEDASNPHGGTDGEKKLGKETMILIDVGAHLHGYSSDVTRSFFPPFLPQHAKTNNDATMSDSLREKLKVWDIVHDAQTASMQEMREGATAAAVDVAAREVIKKHGYGSAFTHRLGHGIGIQGHESPYLNKGNINTTLKAGMVFTSEPGIYLVDKFGVRLEDVLLVKDGEFPNTLSGRRAIDPWHP